MSLFFQDSKSEVKTNKKPEVWQRSIGSLSSKRTLSGLVVKKKSNLPPPSVLNKNSNQKLNSNTETEESLQEKELAARNTTAENISTTLRCSSSDSDSTSKKSTNQNSCSANDITEEENSSSQGKEDIQKAEKETLITEKKQDETVSNKIMVKQGETISDKITVTSSTNAKSQVGSTVTAVNGEIISKGIQGSGGLGLLGAYSDSESNESDWILDVIIVTDKRGYPHNIFLISLQKHMLWVLRGASNEYPQDMFLWRNGKKISIFWMKKGLICCYV